MTILSSAFAVQRGTDMFYCRGEDLPAKLKDGDMVAVQREGVIYYTACTGGKFPKIKDTDILACTYFGLMHRVSGMRFNAIL